MPKISTYATTTPALTDKLIGTDANDNSATKNFTVGDVIGLVVGPIGFTQDLTAASLYNQQPPSLNTLKQITSVSIEPGVEIEVTIIEGKKHEA